MKNIAKSLRNFVIANVFAIFPLLWAVLGWMPDQIKVRMRGWEETPGSIMANGAALAGEEYGEWSGGRVFRFYLQAGMEWKNLVFRFSGTSGIETVDRVELQKWKLLSLGKRGSGLTEREPGTAEYVFENLRFDSVGVAGGKVAWALAVLELMLLLLSWWCARRRREEEWKELLPSAFSVALVLMLLTQVALPIQSFWANRASYPFSFGELAMAVAWRFAWTSALGILAVTLLARCFGRRVFGVVLALTACIYLEAVFLSNDLAELNGDVFLLQNRQRALWDAMIWLVVSVAILTVHPLIRKRYVRASLTLASMALASLFVTLTTKYEKLADKSHLIVQDFVPIDTVIRNVTYSTNHNVMVFILDSLEREQAHAIMEDPEAGPKLREQFRGFTEYTNNVGALPQTRLAVPNLLTGCYPDDTGNLADYAWSCYGPKSALLDFLETGHDLFVTTCAVGCGYTSRKEQDSPSTIMTTFVLDCPGNGGDAWSLRNVARWRQTPFAAKASVSALTGFSNGSAHLKEWALFPILAQQPISSSSSGTFIWMHTAGVHVPILMNRLGEMLSTNNDSDRGCVEQGVFVMGKLGELMDAFRQKGLYDNSLIIMLGDHGGLGERNFLHDKEIGRLPGNARPCLWVKPMGCTHGFRSRGEPTGHAQVAELLKAAARGNLNEEKITSILENDRRLYRRMTFLGDGWTDWCVERNGLFTVEEHHTSLVARKQVRPLHCGRRYSLFWQFQQDCDADFIFRKMALGFSGEPCLPQTTRAASLEFAVPDADKHYRIHLALYDSEGGSLRFRSDTFNSEWQEFPVYPHGEIVVHGVQADESGIARVLFERASGPDVDVAFTSLLLEEEK